jgi:hypothetical protein
MWIRIRILKTVVFQIRDVVVKIRILGSIPWIRIRI